MLRRTGISFYVETTWIIIYPSYVTLRYSTSEVQEGPSRVCLYEQQQRHVEANINNGFRFKNVACSYDYAALKKLHSMSTRHF